MKFSPTIKVRIHCESELQRRMREVWKRKRSPSKPLAEFYLEAFKGYLQTHKVPKQLTVYERTDTRLMIPEHEKETLTNLEKIARKREVPVAVVIEEALSEYCDKPENYLGKGFYEGFRQRKEKV